MEDPSVDEGTLAYVRRAHNALALKRMEIGALALRFEPPTILEGPRQKRVAPDAAQFPHVLRRYDESLSFFRGYSYNPHRAYFDRDSYGTGKLTFESGVTLLGTQRAQDRWSEAEPLPRGTPAPTRGARLDAFFAMLERRQALTELVGMAPTCVFVGEQKPTAELQAPGSRAPPRPPKRRIPSHRYRRFCVSMRSRSQLFGDILCVAMVERTANGTLRIYTLCSGEAVTKDPGARDWRLRVTQDVSRQWRQLTLRTEYAVFDQPIYNRAFVVTSVGRGDATGDWPMACPAGDHEMLHRLGLLLESPDLQYAPWIAGMRVGSLGALLDLAPPTTSPGDELTPDLWMRYALMSRVYPYALLATKDMEERMRYKAYDQDTPLTQYEVGLFRISVRAAEDTVWLTETVRRERAARKAVEEARKVRKAKEAKEAREAEEARKAKEAGADLPPPEPEPIPEMVPQPADPLDAAHREAIAGPLPGDDQEEVKKEQGPTEPTRSEAIAAKETLAFVEKLHGYGPGKLQELFGDAAHAWAAGRGDSPTWLLNDGKLRTNVGGMGRDPDPGSRWMHAGWIAGSAKRVLRDQIRIRYQWIGANAASPGASLPQHGSGGGQTEEEEEEEGDPEDREMRAFFRGDSLPPSPPPPRAYASDESGDFAGGSQQQQQQPQQLVQAAARALVGDDPGASQAFGLLMGLVFAAGNSKSGDHGGL